MMSSVTVPFPWISEKVWRVWNPVQTDVGQRNPIREPLVVRVSEGDGQRAGRWRIEPEGAAPSSSNLADHEALLETTRGQGYVGQVRWPVCCDRLATLIMSSGTGHDLREIEREAGNLNNALLESHVEDGGGDLPELLQDWSTNLAEIRSGRHAGDGVNLFWCRVCGRVYGAYSEP